MWKVSCLFVLLITIGNCSAYDKINTTVTERSRNVRDHEHRKHNSAANSEDYAEESRPYDEDYNRQDTTRSEGGKLLGNWRNNGAAFEPKWRDGDSVPLVPFDAAKTEPHEVPREDTKSRDRDSSHAMTKARTRDDDVGRTSSNKSVEDAIPDKRHGSASYSSPANHETDDRYTIVNDYERNSRYRNEYESEIVPRGRKNIAATILTDELRYETTEDSDSSVTTGKRKQRYDEKGVEESISRSRYRETFQVHPNEYELNDEEYQKPRPRKRRPPQHYEFSEMRAPTYSVTWSTERYVENAASSPRPSTKRLESPTRRRSEQKNPTIRRDRNTAASVDARRTSENAELKSLLKMQQIEGLSLSELLQRRNLTLNDLLKGKADVLNVLKSTDSGEDSTGLSSIKPKIFEPKKVFTPTERSKWRPTQTTRQYYFDSKRNEVSSSPKSEKVSKIKGSEADEDSLEKLDSAETEDGQRNSNDNEKLSAIVRLTTPIILPRLNSLNAKSGIASTTTTDRSAKDSEQYQNDQGVGKTEKSTSIVEEDEIMEFSDFPVKKYTPSTTNSPTTTRRTSFDEIFEEDSGSTLSIEHILSPTEQTATIPPATTQDSRGIDNKSNDVVAESANDNDTDVYGSFEYQSDEPHEVMEELGSDEELPQGDQPIETSTEIGVTDGEAAREENHFKNHHQFFATSSKPYDTIVSEIEPEARAEIFELFSSGSSAKRLERLLKSRNMSIDELIALRQRGSSRVHLAEVLRSKETSGARPRKINKIDQPYGQSRRDDEIVTTDGTLEETTTIDDLSDVEIDASAEATVTEQQSLTTEEHTNIYSIGTEQGESDTTTERITRKDVQLLDLLSAFDSLPFSVRPDLDITSRTDFVGERRGATEDRRFVEELTEKKGGLDEPTNFFEVGLVEEILKGDAVVPADLEDPDISTNYSSGTFGEERKISSKVRPSIIASGAILGVTIVVFLAIFIVCRIKQKQKYTYRNAFSRAVFQGPVMTARKLSNSSSLNTIMVNVVATSTTKRPERRDIQQEIDDDFDFKSDIDNDSLDANDSWETIPDFMK